MTRVLPRPTPTTQLWFDGCQEGELRLQYCPDCGSYQFYPRTLCTSCAGLNLEWRAASGCGRIASFSIVRRGVSKAYVAPYTVALIDLEEGPRMMSMIVDAEPEAVSVGALVQVDFEAWSEDITMPVFKLQEEV